MLGMIHSFGRINFGVARSLQKTRLLRVRLFSCPRSLNEQTVMKISAQRHLDLTRRLSGCFVSLIFVSALVAFIFTVGERVLPSKWEFWFLVAVFGVPIASIFLRICSGLLCEMARDCTSAQCCRCRSRAYYDPNYKGIYCDDLITYTCRDCKYREVLSTRYIDDDPPPRFRAPDCGGTGGGGG